jgi:hypothetical protein
LPVKPGNDEPIGFRQARDIEGSAEAARRAAFICYNTIMTSDTEAA